MWKNCFFLFLTTLFSKRQSREDHQEDLSSESLFLYRAYIQNSSTGTSIRVLSINQCVDQEWTLAGSVDGASLTLRSRPIEGSCPWPWALGCQYNSYVFDAALECNTSARSITLRRDNWVATLPLHRTPSRKKGALSVCVPPIYWFTDWIKIIFFLESWRSHGTSHVFMYYHSSSRNVLQVVRRYEEEGFVTLVRWPSLPRNSAVDPNLSLYRLAHSLAHNDCVLRLESEFGALVDIDELIVPRNESLLSLVTRRFADPSVGALSFSHRSLLLRPPLGGKHFTFEDLDFSGVLNATECRLDGPSKIHPSEAALLHHRYNHISTESAGGVDLFPFVDDDNQIREAMLNQAKQVFPAGAEFHYRTQQILGHCLKPWRQTQKSCKTPISGCWNVLLPLEDWHFADTSEGYHAL